MTRVVSFAAGPAAGKTTMAHEVFSILKRRGISAGWVNEVPTDLLWEENLKGMQDQLWILGEQNHRIYAQLGKVDYIVTDSCMLMGLYYMKDAFGRYKKDGDPACYENFYWSLVNQVNATFNMYDNEVFWVDRQDRIVSNNRYGLDGPNDTAHEDRLQADKDIRELFDSYRVPYKTVTEAEEVVSALGIGVFDV